FQLPPLRERSDRLALITRIVEEESKRCGAPVQLGNAALECLLGYRWPGNVRQLRHVLRYACAVCEGPLIQLHDLPEQL
ncbi:sigma-54-dependent Fis family transcriptional regulator, partial [Pseudomonas sp. JV245A]|nr:sigma-54-dependent Fis family transcriptional regulator [Pseudomonas sp. JV245A]